MAEDNVPRNELTYHHIVSFYVSTRNLEMCIQLLDDMHRQHLTPTLPIVQGVIELSAELGEPRLALDMANSFEAASFRKLDSRTWMQILLGSAEFYCVSSARSYVEIVDVNIISHRLKVLRLDGE